MKYRHKITEQTINRESKGDREAPGRMRLSRSILSLDTKATKGDLDTSGLVKSQSATVTKDLKTGKETKKYGPAKWTKPTFITDEDF